LLAINEHESPANTDRMMEEICEWGNLKQAMWRVKANKGSAGIDGMRVEGNLAGLARILVFYGDSRGRNYGARGVGNCANDSACIALGIGEARQKGPRQGIAKVSDCHSAPR